MAQLEKMADVLGGVEGVLPGDAAPRAPGRGAEAVLALGKEYRVEVGDPLLAGLERVFGEQVAELR